MLYNCIIIQVNNKKIQFLTKINYYFFKENCSTFPQSMEKCKTISNFYLMFRIFELNVQWLKSVKDEV
jgi:hypothetical protein